MTSAIALDSSQPSTFVSTQLRLLQYPLKACVLTDEALWQVDLASQSNKVGTIDASGSSRVQVGNIFNLSSETIVTGRVKALPGLRTSGYRVRKHRNLSLFIEFTPGSKVRPSYEKWTETTRSSSMSRILGRGEVL